MSFDISKMTNQSKSANLLETPIDEPYPTHKLKLLNCNHKDYKFIIILHDIQFLDEED